MRPRRARETNASSCGETPHVGICSCCLGVWLIREEARHIKAKRILRKSAHAECHSTYFRVAGLSTHQMALVLLDHAMVTGPRSVRLERIPPRPGSVPGPLHRHRPAGDSQSEC